MTDRRQLTTADLVANEDQDAALRAAAAVLPGIRRPLIEAPSEGPLAAQGTIAPSHALVSGDPSTLEATTIGLSGDQGRAAPMLPPSPAPSRPAHRYQPAIGVNPNHFEHLHNLQDKTARVPLASLPEGRQNAYPLRRDWRRPAPIQPAAVDPGSG